MSTKLIVFESSQEIIVGTLLDRIVELYFVEGGRCIDDYDVWTVDPEDGVTFAVGMRLDDANDRHELDTEALLGILPPRITDALERR